MATFLWLLQGKKTRKTGTQVLGPTRRTYTSKKLFVKIWNYKVKLIKKKARICIWIVISLNQNKKKRNSKFFCKECLLIKVRVIKIRHFTHNYKCKNNSKFFWIPRNNYMVDYKMLFKWIIMFSYSLLTQDVIWTSIQRFLNVRLTSIQRCVNVRRTLN